MFDYIDANRKFFEKSLAPFTSFKLGGNAKLLLKLHNSEVERVISDCKANKLDFFVIGLGCNVLIADSGIDGVVVNLIDDKILVDNQTLTADCGANLQKVVKIACEHGLSGLEWAFGLPSTVGGAVYGNAGTRHGCIASVLNSCQVLTKNGIINYSVHQCQFEYRGSVFKGTDNIILRCTFHLEKSTVPKVRQKALLLSKDRNNPKGLCAGSIFKNGKDFIAGQLIDRAGLKGKKIGGALVSLQHGNFIINDGTATAKDVFDLIKFIKDRVMSIYGIVLQEEIQLKGF
ncbi:MAG: UDP-N-acetylmuramate dehydrogenase [Clostridiales bacterium]|jgi:UDP-N-acetylmuramate dehydrogenase|nr:UDP-N-acetylmuramate dehydrogenase [Clostridiales bacterium]